MSYLIRSTSHGNDVAVVYLNPPDIFRKISRSPKSDRYVESEYQGLSWYGERLGRGEAHFVKNRRVLPGYSRVDIRRINGVHANYRDPMTVSEKLLTACIHHYVDVWPNEATVPCHGDLTLDNVFSTAEGPVFFDWEHFYSPGEAWGFDAAYLLMSAASLSHKRTSALPAAEQAVIQRLWRVLKDAGLSGPISSRPLDHFRETFAGSQHWRGIVEQSPGKLFPVWLEQAFVDYIHGILDQV